MTDASRDPLVHRAIEELRKLPPADASAIQRVVAAAAAARLTPSDDEAPMLAPYRVRPRRVWSMVGLAAAAAVVGFVVRGAWKPSSPVASEVVATATASSQAAPIRGVSVNERESMPVLHQFVFNDRRAHRIAVVGDFNRWDPASALMNRSPDGEMWSVTLPITPGRHMYGFMIDDSLFVLDPRMPKARDPDLGAEGSIVIVVRP
jgi:hypothetical protein